jgi:RNA polymerase sigma factor (sigma-70 family)
MHDLFLSGTDWAAAREDALSGADRAVSLLARDQYLRVVAWTAPLAVDEEEALLTCLFHGREEQRKLCPDERVLAQAQHARDRLIEGYQPLVLTLARSWLRRVESFDLMDLVQEGNLAVLEALAHYDETCCFPLKALVIASVRRALNELCWSDGMVRVPEYDRVFLKALNRAFSSLFQRCGREPSPVELAHEMQVPLERVFELLALRHCQVMRSLEGLIEREDAPEEYLPLASPFASSATQTLPEWKVERVRQAMETLTPRQREVMRLRYGFAEVYADSGMSQVETAQWLGVTQRRVCTAEQAAKYHLRDVLASASTEEGGVVSLPTLPCGTCGKPVPQVWGRVRRYCSRRCDRRAYKLRRKTEASCEERVITCLYCQQKVVHTGRRERRYCSPACRKKAYQKRLRVAAQEVIG